MTTTEKPNRLEVTTSDKKYTVIMDHEGKLYALRCGETWRDCVGDQLIFQLASDLEDTRKALETEVAETSYLLGELEKSGWTP